MVDGRLAIAELVRAPFHQLGILLTRRCPLECAHCCTRSGPDVDDAADEIAAKTWIDQAVALGIRDICFTGGDPFVALPALRTLVAHAGENHAIAGAITSAFWATSERRAKQVLRQLPGLHYVGLSYDMYHADWTPPERVQFAFAGAKAVGLQVMVGVCYPPWQSPPEAEVHRLFPGADIYCTPLNEVGRGATLLPRLVKQALAEQVASQTDDAGFCPYMVPFVNTRGSVLACCVEIDADKTGDPRFVGRFADGTLDDAVDRMLHDPFLVAVREVGIRKMWQMLETDGYEVPNYRSTAYSVCTLCSRMCADQKAVERVRALLEERERAPSAAAARAEGWA